MTAQITGQLVRIDSTPIGFEYRHVSWFTPEELNGKRRIRMCQSCGNTNRRRMDCPNCDINFMEFIEIPLEP